MIAIKTNGQITIPVGSVSTPSLTFAGDTDTGLYWVAADDMAITAGGNRVMDFTSSGIINRMNVQWQAGSLAEAGLGIISDYNTGFYSPGDGIVGITSNGAEIVRITSAGVGIGGAPNAAALLDISSTTQGFLPPRMTTTQRDAIGSPLAGLVVYNSTTNVLNFFNGTAWSAV